MVIPQLNSGVKVTLEEALFIISLIKPLLETPEAKALIKMLLDIIEDHIKDSKNKIDDFIGLPCIAILKRVIGV